MTTAASRNPRLMLVDGHSLAYRAFHALPVESLTTSAGQVTNAVFGFTSMLINTVRDEAPTHLAVAFDVSRRSFRTEMYPEYKGTRSASPPEFSGQVDVIREVLAALNIPVFSREGFEADDIIATWAARARAADIEVEILTGDRDAFQLVDDHVTVLYPKKGVSDLARIDPAAVTERYGVGPELYRDLAALVGESSDNLIGVPGVGPKTAAKWLIQFGNLPTLLDHASEVPGKAGESLREHLDAVRLNHELNRLLTDVEVDGSVDDLVRASIDTARVSELFDSLEFKVLRSRLFEAWQVQVDRPADAVGLEGALATPAVEVQVVEPEPGGWAAALTRVSTEGRVAVHTVSAYDRGVGSVDLIAIAAQDGTVTVGAPGSLAASDRDALAEFLRNPLVPKAFYDAKPQLLALRAVGFEVAGIETDAALAAYLVQSARRTADLNGLVAERLGVELAATGKGKSSAQLSFDVDGDDERQEALVRAARAVLDVCLDLDRDVVTRGAAALLRDMEIPLLSVLADMEFAGIALDVPYLRELEGTFAEAVAEAEADAHEVVGSPFNLGSTKQLRQILFEDRGLPVQAKTAGGVPSTDAESLTKLAAVSDDPLLAHLLRWRDVSRLRQTVASLLPLVDADGRVHTTFNQTIAATGRLSSTDPNLQNIPVRTEQGRLIRSGFIVGDGYESLMTADYSQIEMRIMAHLSQDQGLIEAFHAGEDLHTTVASQVFGVPAAQVDAEQRRRIKAMSYGLAYGLSDFGLAQQLAISRDEAKRLTDDYFARFGGVRDYLTSVVEEARETGYTETIMGRRRYLPELQSTVRNIRQNGERMALNAPIQGSAADIVKIAMLRVDNRLRAESLASRMLLQVHDELVLEVAPGESATVEALLREEMGSAFDLAVPLDVSVGHGRTWQDAAH